MYHCICYRRTPEGTFTVWVFLFWPSLSSETIMWRVIYSRSSSLLYKTQFQPQIKYKLLSYCFFGGKKSCWLSYCFDLSATRELVWQISLQIIRRWNESWRNHKGKWWEPVLEHSRALCHSFSSSSCTFNAFPTLKKTTKKPTTSLWFSALDGFD